MFGNQDEITNKQLYSMIINIVGCNYLHESIISTFIESIDQEYSNRVRVVSLLKSDQLMNSNESNKEPGFGLLNMTWMRKTLNYRPATVIIVYDIRNKSDNISLKDYENSIFTEITKIKKSDNYPFTNIVLLIYNNNSSFIFDSYSEDKERPYNLKKVIDLKNIFYINGVDGLKTIAKKFSAYVMKITLNYYRAIKKNMKIKKNNTVDVKEKTIKYNIKLGVVSQIKNRKKNLKFIKYYEEGYNMLQTIDFKNYFFGSNDVKWNYLEIKSVADWLLFKIINLKTPDLHNSIQSLINMFVFHMRNYSRIDLLTEENGEIIEKNESIEKSVLGSMERLVIVEYFWSTLRYEFFAKFLEENFKPDFYIKNYLNFPGYYYMVRIFFIFK
jgi:hypothetical protein